MTITVSKIPLNERSTAVGRIRAAVASTGASGRRLPRMVSFRYTAKGTGRTKNYLVEPYEFKNNILYAYHPPHSSIEAYIWPRIHRRTVRQSTRGFRPRWPFKLDQDPLDAPRDRALVQSLDNPNAQLLVEALKEGYHPSEITDFAAKHNLIDHINLQEYSRGNNPGYWLTPRGNLVDCQKQEHIIALLRNSELYDELPSDLKILADRLDRLIDGNRDLPARAWDLIVAVVNLGWIRISGWRSESIPDLSFTVKEINNSTKRRITAVLDDLGIDAYSPHTITIEPLRGPEIVKTAKEFFLGESKNTDIGESLPSFLPRHEDLKYWLTPRGKLVRVYGNSTHIEDLLSNKNLRKELSNSQLKSVEQAVNSRGDYSPVQNVFTDLINNNWIRISGWFSRNYGYEIAAEIRGTTSDIRRFRSSLEELGFNHKSEIRITLDWGTGNSKQTAKEFFLGEELLEFDNSTGSYRYWMTSKGKMIDVSKDYEHQEALYRSREVYKALSTQDKKIVDRIKNALVMMSVGLARTLIEELEAKLIRAGWIRISGWSLASRTLIAFTLNNWLRGNKKRVRAVLDDLKIGADPKVEITIDVYKGDTKKLSARSIFMDESKNIDEAAYAEKYWLTSKGDLIDITRDGEHFPSLYTNKKIFNILNPTIQGYVEKYYKANLKNPNVIAGELSDIVRDIGWVRIFIYSSGTKTTVIADLKENNYSSKRRFHRALEQLGYNFSSNIDIILGYHPGAKKTTAKEFFLSESLDESITFGELRYWLLPSGKLYKVPRGHDHYSMIYDEKDLYNLLYSELKTDAVIVHDNFVKSIKISDVLDHRETLEQELVNKMGWIRISGWAQGGRGTDLGILANRISSPVKRRLITALEELGFDHKSNLKLHFEIPGSDKDDIKTAKEFFLDESKELNEYRNYINNHWLTPKGKLVDCGRFTHADAITEIPDLRKELPDDFSYDNYSDDWDITKDLVFRNWIRFSNLNIQELAFTVKEINHYTRRRIYGILNNLELDTRYSFKIVVEPLKGSEIVEPLSDFLLGESHAIDEAIPKTGMRYWLTPKGKLIKVTQGEHLDSLKNDLKLRSELSDNIKELVDVVYDASFTKNASEFDSEVTQLNQELLKEGWIRVSGFFGSRFIKPQIGFEVQNDRFSTIKKIEGILHRIGIDYKDNIDITIDHPTGVIRYSAKEFLSEIKHETISNSN